MAQIVLAYIIQSIFRGPKQLMILLAYLVQPAFLCLFDLLNILTLVQKHIIKRTLFQK